MSVDPSPAAGTGERLDGEGLEVWRRRFQEALDAGLPVGAAFEFAHSQADIGELRALVKAGCPADTIARIVL